jgi:hypothetical protein
VVFPSGEFSKLTNEGDIWRILFQERSLRTVTPSSWEAGDAWREPLEIARFQEWDYSVNFPFALLVSDLTRLDKLKTARAGQWNAALRR